MNEPISHREAFELLPWYVNGTLRADEQATVARHVRDCLPCRIALREQTRLEALLKRQPTVHLSAEPSFDRLIKGIDGIPRRRLERQGSLWPSLAFLSAPGRAATVAIALVATLGLALFLGVVVRDATRDAVFVTTTEPSTPAVELDIVFAEGISEAELRAVIHDVGGIIVDGPSNIGRYRVRLAVRDGDPSEAEALTRLRADTRVRLASRAYTVESSP